MNPDVGLPEAEAKNYFRQLLAGVGFLHSRGFCHRDVKPENILFTEDGRLKLIDLGNTTVLRSRNNEHKKQFRVCGTPPYMAPEIWRNNGYYGPGIKI